MTRNTWGEREAATKALVGELASELPEQGIVSREVAALPVEVEQWRRAARAAGRALGRRVQTRIHPSGALVWAALGDWPATEQEQARHARAMRDAVLSLPDLTTGRRLSLVTGGPVGAGYPSSSR